jgi:hypothetical protein
MAISKSLNPISFYFKKYSELWSRLAKGSKPLEKKNRRPGEESRAAGFLDE